MLLVMTRIHERSDRLTALTPSELALIRSSLSEARARAQQLLDRADALMRAQEGSWIHAYVVLSLLVGVRTEEARALKWENVHTEATADLPPHVDVWRSVRRSGETKTRKSRRSLAMPYQAAAVMAVQRERQQSEYAGQGREWSEDELVFPNEAGGLRSALNVRRNFRRLLKVAGFANPHEWTTRELRTSTVSLLSDHGIPIEVIARVVGHSGTNTTERVYRKQLRPVIADGAEAMDNIFGRAAEERTASPRSPR
ncbi:tyrosine-type recombinase/integrase [Streptomyces sp. NRRL S-1448]|uniref:tyrosine-type recombinase/integrase n=1 Tax=Streptomyces sp. NRRL S-1448 TaxID=1463883 RepID=UPI00099C35BB|nr:tyrosine-type recombinase/integrase [Streptomyces sp. NRRL S-1448]